MLARRIILVIASGIPTPDVSALLLATAKSE